MCSLAVGDVLKFKLSKEKSLFDDLVETGSFDTISLFSTRIKDEAQKGENR